MVGDMVLQLINLVQKMCKKMAVYVIVLTYSCLCGKF